MKWISIVKMAGLFMLTAMLSLGCGGGGGVETSTAVGARSLTSLGWYFENSAPDYSNDGSTCFLVAYLHYPGTITADDVESCTLTAPNNWRWTWKPSSSNFGTSSTGKTYIRGRYYYGNNPQAFPLAGAWTGEIKLKNGESWTVQRNFHEPGSSANATHPYVYTAEDWTPSISPSGYVAALGRFPSEGYTLQYSAADGGSITSTGLPAVRATFLASQPAAFNTYCWLYDVDKNYLGNSIAQYSPVDHSNSTLITNAGELQITPAATSSSSTGPVDLSRVKYLRIVYVDGAQFVPESYGTFDYRSISYLVPVN